MLYVYPCVLEAEDEGGFSAHFPDLPEALMCGDDRQSALEMAEDALVVPLGARIDDRKHIPVPRRADLRHGSFDDHHYGTLKISENGLRDGVHSVPE